MFKLKIEGLEQLQRRLHEMKDAAEELEGTHRVSVLELLTENFMRANTEFVSFSEMVDASGLRPETADDFATEEWNAFVRARTRFDTWKEMLATAVEKYTAKKLGFD